MIEVKGSFNWTAGDPEKPFDAKALGKVLDRNPSGHLYHFRYPLTRDRSPGYDQGLHRRRHHAARDDAGRHRGGRASRGRALQGAGRQEGGAAAGRARDPDRRRRVFRSREGLGRGEDHAGARLQRLRGRQAPQAAGSINIFDAKAQLNENVPEKYRGLDRFVARKRVVADLEALGLVEKIEPHAHAVPHAQRGNAVVEPWLTDQWYVNAAELAKQAIAAVESGKTKFVPQELGEDLLRVDAQHPALVHLAPALVGAPDPGVVRAGRQDLRRRSRTRPAAAKLQGALMRSTSRAR